MPATGVNSIILLTCVLREKCTNENIFICIFIFHSIVSLNLETKQTFTT